MNGCAIQGRPARKNHASRYDRIHFLILVSLAGLLIGGCGVQTHAVRYTLNSQDVQTPGETPYHALRVAVAPVPREKHVLSPLTRLNYEALSNRLAEHLVSKKAFAAQEMAGSGVWKNTPQEIQRLKARGIDALLLPRVVQFEGGRAKSGTEQAGEILGSPLLMIVGAGQKTVYTVTSKVEFKLVSTLDGNTLWYGSGLGSAYGHEGLGPAIDASFKAALSNVINDLCAAQLDRRRLNGAGSPP